MTTESLYHMECVCGREVTSHTTTAKCPKCHRLLEVEGWGELSAVIPLRNGEE